MADKRGVITQYNSVNRFGYIRAESGGELTGFYFNVVSNGEVAPKANDKVEFDAPEPRKNKKGQIVQGNASAVNIVERAPEPPPGRSDRDAGRRNDRSAYSDPRPRRGRFGEKSGGRPGGRPGERRDRNGPDRRDASGRGAERSGADRSGAGDRPGREGPNRNGGPGRGGRDGQRRPPGGGQRLDSRGPVRPGADGSRPYPQDRGAGRGRRDGRPGDRPGQRPGERARGERRSGTDPRMAAAGGRSRFPLSKEFKQRRPDFGICNPGLLLDKFIEWPAGPERRGAGSETTAAWIFEERHNSYFLHHTFAQTFSRFWGHHVPWYGLKIRREAEIGRLIGAGFQAATVEAAGESVLAVQRFGEGFGKNHGFSIDSRYGYPVIPPWAIVSLLRNYLKSEAAAASSSEAERNSVLEALTSGSITLLDAFPLTYEVRPVIKRIFCAPAAEWFAGTVKPYQRPSVAEPGPDAAAAPEIGQPSELVSAETTDTQPVPPAEVQDTGHSGSENGQLKRAGRKENRGTSRPMHCLVFDRPVNWRFDFISTEKSNSTPTDLAARFTAEAIVELNKAKAKFQSDSAAVKGAGIVEVAESSAAPGQAGPDQVGPDSSAPARSAPVRRPAAELGVLL